MLTWYWLKAISFWLVCKISNSDNKEKRGNSELENNQLSLYIYIYRIIIYWKYK